ncbi:hypothetical protein EVAR_53921_1 [Eumeta japonica]|uniref:Uncharacterized protein n=1 Tax=Eumeta variegata TaxID=151549 RepID=A0A4C1YIC6_EUMVA|nr:hypothetical protein EVAR_53921_1 [Eumeta japonica]
MSKLRQSEEGSRRAPSVDVMLTSHRCRLSRFNFTESISCAGRGLPTTFAPVPGPLNALPETWSKRLNTPTEVHRSRPSRSTYFPTLACGVLRNCYTEMDSVIGPGKQSTKTLPGDLKVNIRRTGLLKSNKETSVSRFIAMPAPVIDTLDSRGISWRFKPMDEREFKKFPLPDLLNCNVLPSEIEL